MVIQRGMFYHQGARSTGGDWHGKCQGKGRYGSLNVTAGSEAAYKAERLPHWGLQRRRKSMDT